MWLLNFTMQWKSKYTENKKLLKKVYYCALSKNLMKMNRGFQGAGSRNTDSISIESIIEWYFATI